MDYITVIEAAKKAGKSEKTIRRAVEDNKLTARSRVHKNEPLFIELASLEAYITSRRSVQIARSESVDQERIEALETCVQEQQRHIEALEQRVNTLRDMLLRTQGDVEYLEVQTTTTGLRPPRATKKAVPDLQEENTEDLVNFWEFAARHGVAVTDAKRNITAKMLKPIMVDSVEYLDAAGQRIFWELNHDYKKKVWLDCPNCPHALG